MTISKAIFAVAAFKIVIISILVSKVFWIYDSKTSGLDCDSYGHTTGHH